MTRVINKNKRKAAIFLLFLFLIICIASYQQQAEAFALAPVAVVGVAVCGAALIAYGMAFASTGDFQAAAEAMYDNFNTRIDTIVMSGRLVWSIIKQGYQYITTLGETLAADIQVYINDTYDVGEHYTGGDTPIIYENEIPIKTDGVISTQTFFYRVGPAYTASWRHWYEYELHDTYVKETQYDSTKTTVLNVQNINYDATDVNIYVSEDTGTVGIKEAGGASIFSRTFVNTSDLSMAFPLVPTGTIGADGIVDNPEYDWANTGTGEKDIPIDVGSDIPTVVDPEGEIQPDIIWLGPLGQWLGVDLPTLQALLDYLRGLEASDIENADIGAVDVEEIDEPFEDTIEDDIPSEYQPTAQQNNSLKYLMMSKFPFCIPWDIKNAFTLIAASPVAPNFTLDPLAAFVGSGVAEITFDMNEYALIGTICRWMFLIEFCIMLAAGTKKLIWG